MLKCFGNVGSCFKSSRAIAASDVFAAVTHKSSVTGTTVGVEAAEKDIPEERDEVKSWDKRDTKKLP